MSVQRVRYSLDPVKGEMDTFSFADCNHPGVDFLRTLPAAVSGRAIVPTADSSCRQCRVKLEGEPAHLHRPIKCDDSFFQPPFADVAPRTNHVRDHVNTQDHLRSPNPRTESPVFSIQRA